LASWALIPKTALDSAIPKLGNKAWAWKKVIKNGIGSCSKTHMHSGCAAKQSPNSDGTRISAGCRFSGTPLGMGTHLTIHLP